MCRGHESARGGEVSGRMEGPGGWSGGGRGCVRREGADRARVGLSRRSSAGGGEQASGRGRVGSLWRRGRGSVRTSMGVCEDVAGGQATLESGLGEFRLCVQGRRGVRTRRAQVWSGNSK